MERNSGILCASVCKKERDGKRVGEDQQRRSKESQKEKCLQTHIVSWNWIYTEEQNAHIFYCVNYFALCVCVLLMGGLALVASLEVAHSHTHACMAKLCWGGRPFPRLYFFFVTCTYKHICQCIGLSAHTHTHTQSLAPSCQICVYMCTWVRLLWINRHTYPCTGVVRNLHEITQKRIHSYIQILATFTTHSHTCSELISVQCAAAFEGSRGASCWRAT